MKTAKQYIKKYRRFVIIGFLALVVLWFVLYNVVFQKSFIGLLFAYALLVLTVVALKIYARNKWLIGPLLNDLNAPLYYEIITTGRFYDRTASVYLQAEYFMGHYENAVAICNQMLAKPRVGKKYRYVYLTYLAHICYNTGDREGLQEICQQVRDILLDEKPKGKKKMARFLERLRFYDNYLDQNWDACEQYVAANVGTTAHSHIVNFNDKARIALAKGEMEKAKIFFQEVQKAPLLCYANHATHAIEAIEAGRPYNEGIEPVSENKEYRVPTRSKAIRVLYWVALTICIIYTILSSLQSCENLNYKQIKYKRDIREAVEKDFDDVKVLKTFNLMRGDEIADSMAVCEVDDGLILASVYTYEGEARLYYEQQSFVSLEMMERDPLKHISHFFCVTSDTFAEIHFYNQKSDVPKDAIYSFGVRTHDKNIYIAVITVKEHS